MLEGIGKIGDYVNLHNLKIEAKYRLKTGQDMKKQFQKQVEDVLWKKMTKVNKKTDEARIAGIKQKLRSGKELSASEMKYLKETDEDLYNKAKKAQETREELRNALKHAKTKSEARMALVQAQSKVATEAMLDAKNGSGAGAMNAAAGTGGTAASAGSASETASAENPGGDATGAAAMDTSMDAMVSDSAQAETAAGASSANGAADAKASATDGTAGADDAMVEKTDTADEKEAKYPNRMQTLENLERGGNSSDGLDFDNKYLYMLRALQDEWNNYSKDHAYQDLPEYDLEAMDEPAKQPQLWNPKRKNTLTAANDAYHTAENLLLFKKEAEGTTEDVSS